MSVAVLSAGSCSNHTRHGLLRSVQTACGRQAGDVISGTAAAQGTRAAMRWACRELLDVSGSRCAVISKKAAHED
jgi:hypothetical protein